MEYFKYIVWTILSIIILLISYAFITTKKEKQITYLSKILYTPLGFLSVVILTPAVTHLLTLNVSSFEGARGYAYLYILPIVFIGLLIVWFFIHKDLSNKKGYYKKTTTSFAFITLIVLSAFTYSEFKRKEEKQLRRQNSISCKKQYKDSYSGIVIDTSRGNLKIRKMDSTYHEFKYYYRDKNFTRKHCYIGQKVTKQSNTEIIKITLRDKEVIDFTIPCYKKR